MYLRIITHRQYYLALLNGKSDFAAGRSRNLSGRVPLKGKTLGEGGKLAINEAYPRLVYFQLTLHGLFWFSSNCSLVPNLDESLGPTLAGLC